MNTLSTVYCYTFALGDMYLYLTNKTLLTCLYTRIETRITSFRPEKNALVETRGGAEWKHEAVPSGNTRR